MDTLLLTCKTPTADVAEGAETYSYTASFPVGSVEFKSSPLQDATWVRMGDRVIFDRTEE